MALLVGAVLALIALAGVLRPFLRPSTLFPDDGSSSETEGIRVQREALYREIAVLHFELELGHIESSEYEERLREYRLLAAASLQQQEAREEVLAALDNALEEQVRIARQSYKEQP